LLNRFIPTPSTNKVELGPFTLHYYSLCILLGIIAALIVGQTRWRKSGGVRAELYDLAIYVIPAGIIGGRLYHVITTPELYFGVHGRFINAFKIWEGGMGIWGAVALGALVAYLYFRGRTRSISFPVALDALAPGILIAQAIGRWGNWFNHELFGSATSVPWALRIPLAERPLGYEKFATFQPTFLYESLWCLICAIAILFIPGVRKLRSGNAFILYIFLYCMGRVWIEALRIDDAHHIFGLRLNVWVAAIGAISSLIVLFHRERSEGQNFPFFGTIRK
jgi:prolipoprotein diacylglyceryl transferase